MPAFVGHTSPHSGELLSENFSRPDKDGRIRPVSIIASDKIDSQDLLSGTIYYMVFERDDKNPNDPWGTGLSTVLRQFRPGIDFNGGASPGIDDHAKYLYVYQVINHQRTNPKIESASIKLLVDHSAITSWGYFHGVGFAAKDADGIVRPLSATYKIDQKTYQSPAPQVPISQPLMLADVPTSRGEVEPMREGGSKIVRVHWDALDPAVPPDTVMILGASDFNKHPSFRAIWSGNNAIGKDGRSTVFGFTSNLPPKFEPARLRTVREAPKVKDENELDDAEKEKALKDKIKPVKNVESKAREAVRLAKLAEDEASAGESVAGVEGRVPTPFPVDGELAFAGNRTAEIDKSSSSGAGFPLGGTPVMGGGGGSSAGGGGGGFFPTNSGSGSQGSGSGGGGVMSGGGGTSFVSSGAKTPTVGSGTGVGTGTGAGEGSGTGTGTGSALNNININFSISNLNQQAQEQFQLQKQKQSQHQSQSQSQDQNNGGHCGCDHVVPEPASLIGLALGLPALFYAYRRRGRKANEPSSDPSS